MDRKFNIYQMYVANGNKAGFWVKRNSWPWWQSAQIISINGKSAGVLEGVAPYFNNAKVLGRIGGSGNLIELTCPGTYGYIQINEAEKQ